MDHFNRIVGFITKLCDRIAQACVFAMLLIVFSNILGRMIWRPIYGTFDYVSFICAILVAFGISFCALEKGHIQVDLLVAHFSKRAQGVVDSIVGFLSLGIFSLVTWQCVVYANDMRRTGELSMTMQTPFYPYIYAIGFGCGLLCLVILVDIIKSLVKAVKG